MGQSPVISRTKKRISEVDRALEIFLSNFRRGFGRTGSNRVNGLRCIRWPVRSRAFTGRCNTAYDGCCEALCVTL